MSNTRIVLAENRKSEYMEGIKHSMYSIDVNAPESSPLRPFGSLQLVSETTLGAGLTETFVAHTALQLLVLPLVGEVGIDSMKVQNTVESGEAILVSLMENETCLLFNTYKDADIHFLVAGFSNSESVGGTTRFALEQNTLIEVFRNAAETGLTHVLIGQYDGRSEDVFVPTKNRKVFAWTIQGAFEFQNCLLQKSDGLAIETSEIVEFEALANDSMIILFEFT